MGRLSDEIRVVRRDSHTQERSVEELLRDKEYCRALDAEVARLESENILLAALFATK